MRYPFSLAYIPTTPPPRMPTLRLPAAVQTPGFRRLLRAALIVCTVVGASSARADDFAEIQGLYRSGQSAAAMARVERSLSEKPDDPQMRFLKGVMLADAKRSEEAAAVFLKLTEDHPDLVEPYNNLAALYAAGGDYAKARATLELALRTNPSFAVAHENLGDVYVAMAGQAYARALQLAPADTALAPKLALVRQLLARSADPAAK